ncbi:MAG: hypothetical protein QM611_04455 [Microbacterium sp.]|uniref:hypothetical protein n=1 Tax=Microbacterium sp. TaxID=51671 RepID=UPI0039E3AE59
MIRRRPLVLVGLACLALLASGCDGEPEPVVSTTAGFASEAEAFAAAEKTYRAYVDAGNARRNDENSRPAPDDFLVGQALEDEIAAARQLKAEGLSLKGDVHVAGFVGESYIGQEVTAHACLDVSKTSVVDRDGKDVTPSDRADVQAVNLVLQQSSGQLLIVQSTTGDALAC